MRAIHINSKERTVTDIELPDDPDRELPELQRLVGGNIEIATTFRNLDTVFVNEEGLLHHPEHFFVITGGHQPFAGDAVLVGSDEQGRSRATAYTADDVRDHVVFYTVEEVREKFR